MSDALPSLVARASRETSTNPRPSRPLRALAAISTALVLSSCTLGPVRIGINDTALPALTPIEVIRDQVARTESAAVTRAGVLASDTGDCDSCRTVLSTIENDSKAREGAIGGVWHPWSDQAPEGASQPPAIADAPIQVAEFASWLAQTATRDLAIAADPERTTPDEARLLTSLALGRYRSALALAEVYGLDVTDGDAQVEELTTRMESLAGTESLSVLGTWALDSRPLHTATLLPTPDLDEATDLLASSEELTQALAAWDCVAQSLPRAALLDGTASGVRPRMNALFTRVDALLSAGARDGRRLRCQLHARDADSVSMTLIAADMSLLSSSDAPIRLVGAHAALEDLRAFPLGGEAKSWALIGAEATSPESEQSAPADH